MTRLAHSFREDLRFTKMIFAILVAILAYRRANENGRNGIVWALGGIGVFVGTQMLVTFGAGILIGLGIGFLGWPDDLYEDAVFTWPVTLFAIAMSVLTSWLLLRYLSKPVNPEPTEMAPPPPPPTFGHGGQS